MKAIQHKHRKLIAASVLFTFVMAWVLPVQACFASMGAGVAASVVECPNCTPSGCDSASCGPSMAASCLSHQAPSVTGLKHHRNDIAFIPVLLGIAAPRAEAADLESTPTQPIPVSPVSLNVRFCTFLK